MSIQVRNITRRFGSFLALDDVSLEVPAGQLVAILGPSGSGKSTLLRIIAGLERADGGTILFDGEDAARRTLRDRRVGFVFQHYALFRHMTVFENVAFGLKVRPWSVRPSRSDIRQRVMELLGLVKLDGLADRYPTQLSGGQRQRVGLARALAVEPRVLLLDEPFGALDARVRKELRRWLRTLHEQIHLTSLFVTHDQEEALELGDRVIIMNGGRVEQDGTPDQVYEHPASAFVCDFLGEINRFHGHVRDGRLSSGGVELEFVGAGAGGGAATTAGNGEPSPAIGYVRPHELEVSAAAISAASFAAEVRYVAAIGPIARLELRRLSDNHPLEATIDRATWRSLSPQPGQRLYLTPRKVRVFSEDYSI